jgi:YD repeat-containing protein
MLLSFPEAVMKRALRITALALLSATIVLGGCATRAPAPAPAPLPAAKAPAKTAKQRTVVTKVPVLVKETAFYSDGLVDQYSTYKMDEANRNLVEKATFDPTRTAPVERAVPDYKDGRLAAESLYDADNALRTRREFGYDGAGHLISERVLDSKGTAQSGSAYAWDANGRKVEWRALDGNGGVKATTSYSNGPDGLKSVEMRDAGGKLTGTISLEYAGGRLSRRSYFGADKSLQKFETYAYEGSLLASVELHRADGGVVSRTAYGYGPLGEMVKAAEYGPAGPARAWSTYEYVVREDSATETYYE